MILYSTDKIHWTQATLPLTSAALTSVAWDGQHFVAVGPASDALISSSGSTWNTLLTNTTTQLSDIVSFNGSLLTVGNGVLLSSQ